MSDTAIAMGNVAHLAHICAYRGNLGFDLGWPGKKKKKRKANNKSTARPNISLAHCDVFSHVFLPLIL